MKMILKTVLLTCSLVLAGSRTQAAIIANWTFETSPPADLGNSTTIGPIAADDGIGSASAVHASSATDWSTPAGNGSANSLSANNWAVGDYWQFSASTLGYSDVTISFAAISSGTGPKDFKLAYDFGAGFTDFSSFSVLDNASPENWGATFRPSSVYSFDLSLVGDLDDQATVSFRIISTGTTSANGGTVGGGGTSRVDDFTISATPIVVTAVPEPSTFIAGALLALPFGARGVRYFRDQKRV